MKGGDELFDEEGKLGREGSMKIDIQRKKWPHYSKGTKTKKKKIKRNQKAHCLCYGCINE